MLFLCFSVRDRGVRIRRPRSFQRSKVTVHYSVDSIKPTSIATTHDVKVFDGAVLVHALPSGTFARFSEYPEKVLIPFAVSQLQSCERVDVVWGCYRADSLKEATREKRGKGKRKKFAITLSCRASFKTRQRI